jgi:hypothetical protein
MYTKPIYSGSARCMQRFPPPPLPSSGMGFFVVFPFVAQVLFYFFGVFLPCPFDMSALVYM